MHTAIVTGGLQGIGLAIAAELAKQNVKVAVGARRGADAEHSAAAKAVVGDQGLVAALDVCSNHSIESFVSQSIHEV